MDEVNQPDIAFEWLDPGMLVDAELSLLLVDRSPGDPLRDYVPAYRFEMRVEGAAAGKLNLRVGDTYSLRMYFGHIGYEVAADFRGNRLAARACRLILPLARLHGMAELWVTCNPENSASRRTCELAGAKLIETVSTPLGSDLYARGEPRKCRYRIDLTE